MGIEDLYLPIGIWLLGNCGLAYRAANGPHALSVEGTPNPPTLSDIGS